MVVVEMLGMYPNRSSEKLIKKLLIVLSKILFGSISQILVTLVQLRQPKNKVEVTQVFLQYK